MCSNISNIPLVDLTQILDDPIDQQKDAVGVKESQQKADVPEDKPEIIPYVLKFRPKEEKTAFKILSDKVEKVAELIEGGKVKDVTMDAIQALANEILQQGQSKVSQEETDQLFKKLEGLSEIVGLFHATEQEKVHVPLVGDISFLCERAKTYSEGVVKNGLMNLDRLFVMRSIRGDGHCLFRSALTHMVQKILSLQGQDLENFVEAQDAKVLALKNDELYKKYSTLKASVLSVYEKKGVFTDILLDEKISNEGVHFLREFVCEYHRQNDNDVFSSFVASVGKTKEVYLQEMSNMARAAYGDHPELNALSILFHQNITVVDVATFGKTDDPEKLSQAFSHFKVHENMTDLFLIRRPNHYDLGYIKAVMKREGALKSCSCE